MGRVCDAIIRAYVPARMRTRELSVSPRRDACDFPRHGLRAKCVDADASDIEAGYSPMERGEFTLIGVIPAQAGIQ